MKESISYLEKWEDPWEQSYDENFERDIEESAELIENIIKNNGRREEVEKILAWHIAVNRKEASLWELEERGEAKELVRREIDEDALDIMRAINEVRAEVGLPPKYPVEAEPIEAQQEGKIHDVERARAGVYAEIPARELAIEIARRFGKDDKDAALSKRRAREMGERGIHKFDVQERIRRFNERRQAISEGRESF